MNLYHQRLLQIPIGIFGITMGILIVLIALKGNMNLLNKLADIGGVIFLWLWISMPFYLLLKLDGFYYQPLCTILVYATYAYTSYTLVAHSDEYTAVAESSLIMIAPLFAIGVIFTVCAFERILAWMKSRIKKL